eukprot:481467_1
MEYWNKEQSHSNNSSYGNKYHYRHHIVGVTNSYQKYTHTPDILDSISFPAPHKPLSSYLSQQLPIYYNDKNNEYIMILQGGYIQRYDFNNNIWNMMIMPVQPRYCGDIKYVTHFDEYNKKLYLFTSTNAFQFDVISNEWTYKSCQDIGIDKNTCHYKFCFIPYPINELHLLTYRTKRSKNWYEFECNHKKIIECNNELKVIELATHENILRGSNELIWIQREQILLNIFSQSDRAEVCRITSKNQQIYEWIPCSHHKYMRPHDINISVGFDGLYHRIVGFESILFLINYNEIQCVDMLSGQRFKSNKRLPLLFETACIDNVVNTNDNYVHFIGSYTTNCHKNKRGLHLRMSLLDVVPQTLQNMYINKYGFYSPTLVFGYFYKIKKDYQLSYSVPTDIVFLILSYFSPFPPN